MKKIIVVLFSWFATANLWAFDNVKLSLDWVPQGEHGGYFQAIAKGYYAEHNIVIGTASATTEILTGLALDL